MCGTPIPPATNLPPRIGVDPHDLVIESEAPHPPPDLASGSGADGPPHRGVRHGAVPGRGEPGAPGIAASRPTEQVNDTSRTRAGRRCSAVICAL